MKKKEVEFKSSDKQNCIEEMESGKNIQNFTLEHSQFEMFTVVQIKQKKIVNGINSIKKLNYVQVYTVVETMEKNN